MGYDLTVGLPGHAGIVTVEASGGDYNVSVTSGKKSLLQPGLFIDLDGRAYEIDSIESTKEVISLAEVRRRHPSPASHGNLQLLREGWMSVGSCYHVLT